MNYPKKDSYTVEFWDCGYGHRHKSSVVAQNCIDKQKRKRPVVPAEEIGKRNSRILEMRLSGATQQAIADEVGVTRERVRIVMAMYARKAKVGCESGVNFPMTYAQRKELINL